MMGKGHTCLMAQLVTRNVNVQGPMGPATVAPSSAYAGSDSPYLHHLVIFGACAKDPDDGIRPVSIMFSVYPCCRSPR